MNFKNISNSSSEVSMTTTKMVKKHKLLVMILLGFKFPKLIIKKVVLSQFCE